MTWARHPGVRSDGQLTLGERAADRMRSAMGSWLFIFGALGFLAGWIGLVQFGVAIDNKQLTILNLVLSCVAALQGGVLLIAAKRADSIASQLALHDYGVNQETLALTRRIAAAVAPDRPLP